MNAMDYLRIAPYINDCPACGEPNVGTDENGVQKGTYNVDDNLFTRTCHCGFAITIDSKKGTTKKILKETVDKAVQDFREKNNK